MLKKQVYLRRLIKCIVMDENEEIYLANKHRGGESSRRGNLYEVYYAVFAIFREIAKGNYSTIVSRQVEVAFVDDLLISDGTTNVYHQLKNKKNPSWGSMRHGNLKYDFSMQKNICEERRENFSLKLVVSDKKNRLIERMPDGLKGVTSVEFYPMLDGLNKYIYWSDFADVAYKAVGCEPGENNKLEVVSMILSSLWQADAYSNLDVQGYWTLMEYKWYGEEPIDETLKNQLITLLCDMGFSLKVDKNVIEWIFLHFKGTLRLNDTKMRSLLEIQDVENMIQNLI